MNRVRIGSIGALVVIGMGAAPALAQESVQAPASAAALTLTLDEAIRLAQQNNPAWLSARNDADVAEWGVRSAYGELLPSANANLGMQYQAPGTPSLGGIFTAEELGIGRTPEYYFSSYGLELSYRLSPATIFGIGEARANRRAVSSRVNAARFTMVETVTRQYLAALRARDALRYAQEAVKRSAESWELARARVQVGAASPLDSLQAAVELGRARVEVVQAEATLETEKLRLLEQVGIAVEDSVSLASDFKVFEPTWTRASLLERALANNPELRAARASEDATTAALRVARSAYLPSLTLSADWSGFASENGDPQSLIEEALDISDSRIASCEQLNAISAGLSQPLSGFPVDCQAEFTLDQADFNRLVANNDVFPFDFNKQPLTVSLFVSLPIFQGFDREERIEMAQAAHDDARHDQRAAELRLRTAVASALESLESSHRSVEIEATNRELARLRFELAQERYRLGVAGTIESPGAGNIAATSPFIELQQAAADVAQADQSYLDSVYTFHESLVALEAAVGEQLRP
ncbi:MAG: TolC family protein [Longimicrobiales bacterium]